LWESVKSEVDARFKKIGIKNANFPLLIPERLLKKEAEHFSGFTPEVAWVTHTGSSKLAERLAIRPTSEAIMYGSYRKWIRSWRDLPLRINQWNNVIRWEFKHPTPFLRDREFLWNEGHCVYASAKEVLEDRDKVLNIYVDVLKNYMALPGVVGRKTDKEKFAGAVATYPIEHLLPDGKAIQGPDYHDDGQNFAKAFDITFLDKNEKKRYAHQSTFAITTRVLGVMLATHGDDKGLVIPPRLAQTQVVIVPIYKTKERARVLAVARKLANQLDKCYLDDRDYYSPGWKFNEWELKGIPIRIEIGPKDLVNKQAILVRRDTGAKKAVPLAGVKNEVAKLLLAIHKNLYARAKKFMVDNTRPVKTQKEFGEAVKKGGFILAAWCGSLACEDMLKDKYGTKATNMPFDAQKGKIGKCIWCNKAGKHVVNWARSY
jgi:prolyl-tRNA synthetase